MLVSRRHWRREGPAARRSCPPRRRRRLGPARGWERDVDASIRPRSRTRSPLVRVGDLSGPATASGLPPPRLARTASSGSPSVRPPAAGMLTDDAGRPAAVGPAPQHQGPAPRYESPAGLPQHKAARLVSGSGTARGGCGVPVVPVANRPVRWRRPSPGLRVWVSSILPGAPRRVPPPAQRAPLAVQGPLPPTGRWALPVADPPLPPPGPRPLWPPDRRAARACARRPSPRQRALPPEPGAQASAGLLALPPRVLPPRVLPRVLLPRVLQRRVLQPEL